MTIVLLQLRLRPPHDEGPVITSRLARPGVGARAMQPQDTTLHQTWVGQGRGYTVSRSAASGWHVIFTLGHPGARFAGPWCESVWYGVSAHTGLLTVVAIGWTNTLYEELRTRGVENGTGPPKWIEVQSSSG